MAQFLRPTSDTLSVNFTGGWAQVDEASASDADLAYGANNTVAELELQLSAPAATPAAGTCTVRYRIAKTNAGALDGGGNAVTVAANLRQGASVIQAALDRAATGTWTTYTFTFATSAITDWSNLRFYLLHTASGGNPANRRGAGLSWIEVETPDGGVSEDFPQAIDASGTGTPLLTRLVERLRTLAGSGTGTPELVAQPVLGRTLASSGTGAPALTKQTAHLRPVVASGTGAPALTKQVEAHRSLAAVGDGMVLLDPVTARGRAFEAVGAGTAALSRVVARHRTLAAAGTGTPAMARGFGVSQTLEVSGTGSPALTPALSFGRILAVTGTGSPALARFTQAFQPLAVVGAGIAVLRKGIAKTLGVTGAGGADVQTQFIDGTPGPGGDSGVVFFRRRRR